MDLFFWHRADGTTPNGPLSLEELKGLARSGELQRGDFVWKEDWDDWQPADMLSGLFLVPPPIPVSRAEPKPPPTKNRVAGSVGTEEQNYEDPSAVDTQQDFVEDGLEDQGEVDDVEVLRAGKWAKWFGLAKVGIGIYGLVVLGNLDVPFPVFTPLDFLFQLVIGGVSFYLGLKILNPETRRQSQLTTLIWMYGIVLTLHMINWVIVAGEGAQATGTGSWVPILTGWALWVFIKGRRELRSVEARQNLAIQ